MECEDMLMVGFMGLILYVGIMFTIFTATEGLWWMMPLGVMMIYISVICGIDVAKTTLPTNSNKQDSD